ncbi:uncharacterized protein LOC135685327 [Rhopilema esculentum]|uniref:uncharacterized protein LOC135685327 n=1 Tax=Rhopilema esculentum TaxID=499914 RepID=UPI0031CDF9C4
MALRSMFKFSLPRPPKKRPEDHGILLRDPAIERWAKMRETTHLYFKLRPKTVLYGVIWGIIVPGAFYYALKWDLHRQDKEAGRPPRDFL